jgi:hypothetical protein
MTVSPRRPLHCHIAGRLGAGEEPPKRGLRTKDQLTRQPEHTTSRLPTGIKRMRLLNTASITLREFIGGGIPPYAILSHTWETEEVLLADMLNGAATSKKGYAKIKSSCLKAAEKSTSNRTM